MIKLKIVLEHSYYPNYFAIEDIIATQEKAPCKFLVNIPKLGKLNAASEEDDLKAGTSLELPVWLVQQLASGRQPLVTIDLPKSYKPAYREILKADATAVDLHKFGLYFYELGCHIAQFDNQGDVREILVHTFTTRFKQLMDLADNIGLDPSAIDKLDMLERKLFKDGNLARNLLNNWLNNSIIPMGAATMVVNHRKRKRINVE
ncbi:DNA replication complex GINS protein PSF3 [Agrilus planipennis]|uniref:DNA replication complex GINS protein PSF3 n=1 Tax=Agrilus planipennis TaxID=224129 RepID=A0A1W4XJU6_AGRPL|nr:DNA replication complex GINS protein PSF3 [Agrilus planipennis]